MMMKPMISTRISKAIDMLIQQMFQEHRQEDTNKSPLLFIYFGCNLSTSAPPLPYRCSRDVDRKKKIVHSICLGSNPPLQLNPIQSVTTYTLTIPKQQMEEIAP